MGRPGKVCKLVPGIPNMYKTPNKETSGQFTPFATYFSWSGINRPTGFIRGCSTKTVVFDALIHQLSHPLPKGGATLQLS